MKLWQYQEQVSGIPTSLAKERTTPDKWQSATNIPQSNWKKASLYSAAALMPFFVLNLTPVQRVERTTPDKWQPISNVPLFDIKRQQHTYPVTAPQDPTSMRALQAWVDKLQTTNQFLFFPDIKRWQYLYPTFTIDVSQLTQHERITADKWVPETNKPLFDVKRQQHTYSFSFFHPEPQEVTQFESPGEFSRNVDKVYDRARNQYLYPCTFIDPNILAQEEAVSFDRWNYNQSIPRFDVPRNQHLYPSSFFYPEPKEVTDFENVLFQQDVLVRGIPRLQYLNPYLSIDPTALTQRERTTPDKWQAKTNEPVFDVKRNQFFYPSQVANIFPIEEPAEIQDAGIYQTNVPYFPTKHTEYLYQTFGIDPTQLTQAERITLDKWFKDTEHTLWDKTRSQYLYPASLLNPYPLPNAEVVTTDKWHPLIVQPLFDLKRQQFVYPYLSIDASHLLDHETITISKWFVPVSQPLGRRSVILPVNQAGALFVAENITLDKWFSQTQQIHSKSRVQFVQITFTPEHTVLAPLDHWFPPTQQPIFLPKQHRYIQYSFDLLHRLTTFWTDKLSPRNTITTDKFSTRNTSFNDKYSGRGSTFDDKYSGRGSSFDDKYSSRGSNYQDKYPKT